MGASAVVVDAPFSHMSTGTIIENALDGMSGELRHAVAKELASGILRETVNAQVQQKKIAKFNSDHQFKSIDGLGRLRMRIDSTLYHQWGQKLGYDCWKDNQFLREVERDNPEVRVKCGGTKLQVGWSGSSKKFSKKY